MTPQDRCKRIIAEVSGVKSQYGVNEADWSFVNDIARRAPSTLSRKQEEWVADIERRVFGPGE